MTTILRLSAITALTLATMGMSQAATKIRYEELRGRQPAINHRGVNVVTLDGKEHHGRQLAMALDHARVFQHDNKWEDVPSDQIARIEISQGGRYFHHIKDSAELPLAGAGLFCGWDSQEPPICAIPVTAILSPIWAYTAATAPFYLAADAVAFLIPPKVYEIIH